MRYALRQIRRAPGFAITVALTLALSVGVATAVFCVIDTVILRPLPYAHPERIVSIQSISRSGYTQPASWPSFRDERAQAHAFAALAGYNDFFSMHHGDPVQRSCAARHVFTPPTTSSTYSGCSRCSAAPGFPARS